MKIAPKLIAYGLLLVSGWVAFLCLFIQTRGSTSKTDDHPNVSSSPPNDSSLTSHQKDRIPIIEYHSLSDAGVQELNHSGIVSASARIEKRSGKWNLMASALLEKGTYVLLSENAQQDDYQYVRAIPNDLLIIRECKIVSPKSALASGNIKQSVFVGLVQFQCELNDAKLNDLRAKQPNGRDILFTGEIRLPVSSETTSVVVSRKFSVYQDEIVDFDGLPTAPAPEFTGFEE